MYNYGLSSVCTKPQRVLQPRVNPSKNYSKKVKTYKLQGKYGNKRKWVQKDANLA